MHPAKARVATWVRVADTVSYFAVSNSSIIVSEQSRYVHTNEGGVPFPQSAICVLSMFARNEAM